MNTQNSKTKKTKTSLWSLVTVTMVPLFLTMTITYMFGSSKKYQALTKPIWFPSLQVIHLGSFGSTISMSQAARLVRANGGFGLDSDSLPLYIAQVALSIIWVPVVLRIGAAWLGFFYCMVHLGTLLGCYWVFGNVSPGSRFFIRPSLAWVTYLTLVTFNLMYL